MPITGSHFPFTSLTPSSTKHFVGLPAAANTYTCPAGSYNGGCQQTLDARIGTPPYYAAEWITSSHLYYYGPVTATGDWTSPPGNSANDYGELTRERQFLRFATPATYADKKYADSAYTYDAWGNRSQVSVWKEEGTEVAFAASTPPATPEITTYCYGAYQPGSGNSCLPDDYHTYLGWEMNAKGYLTQYQYDLDFGQVSWTQDPNLAVAEAAYDPYERLVSITRPEDSAPSLTMVYNDFTLPFSTTATQIITGSQTTVISKYYNGLGQLLQTQVFGAVVGTATKDIRTDLFYNALGQVIKQTIPYTTNSSSGYTPRSTTVAKTQTAYDVLGRVKIVTAPDNTATTYTYLDLETRVTDARGYITRNLTDIWGRTIQVIPPTNPSVTYTYDALDRLLTANYGGAVTTLTYDYAGRKLSMNDPDMGAWSYAYDALGNLTRQKDAKNQRICFYYDLLNRLTGKHYRTNNSCPNPPTLTTTYTYDTGSINGVGRRTRMDDSSGWTTWDYDLNGRVTRETKQINGAGTFVTRFGYNQDDSLAWMEYPVANPDDNIETVFYAYHPQGLMKNAYSDLYAYYYVQSSQYDAFGRTDLRKLGATNLVEQPKLLYNPTFYAATSQGGRLQNLKTGIPSDDDSLQSLTYTYDNVGNIQTIVDGLNSSQKQCFTYNSLNRLTKGTTYDTSTSCTIQSGVGTYHEEYQYSDTTGNLTSKTGVGSYTYTAGKHRVVTAGLGVSLGYDANGNMTTRTVFGNISTLVYNYENQLTTVSGATSGSFSYDGDGKRVKGTVGGVTTAYVGNYFEWTSAGSTAYYYAGGQRIAMRRAGYTSDNGLFWLLGDHLGSTTVTANSAGVRTAELRYKPWGQARTGVGTTRTSYRFTGQRSEEAGIGLYWYNSRLYDPLIGRWASPDPIIPHPGNPLDFDRYSYVRNNPLRFVDPSGHRPCDDFDENGRCITEPGWLTGRKPNPSANWEICLLAAVVMSETNRGTYSDDWMQTIAWIYLNRVSLINSQNTIWLAVKGNQSAVTCYYAGCNGEGLKYPGLPSNPSKDDLARYWSSVYSLGSSGSYASGWMKAYENAKLAYTNWKKYGTGSAHDPTNGATDFRMVKPEEFETYNYAYTSYTISRPHFQYYFLGPQYIPGLGEERYMFVSNLEYSNVLDVYHSQSE